MKAHEFPGNYSILELEAIEGVLSDLVDKMSQNKPPSLAVRRTSNILGETEKPMII